MILLHPKIEREAKKATQGEAVHRGTLDFGSLASSSSSHSCPSLSIEGAKREDGEVGARSKQIGNVLPNLLASDKADQKDLFQDTDKSLRLSQNFDEDFKRKCSMAPPGSGDLHNKSFGALLREKCGPDQKILSLSDSFLINSQEKSLPPLFPRPILNIGGRMKLSKSVSLPPSFAETRTRGPNLSSQFSEGPIKVLAKTPGIVHPGTQQTTFGSCSTAQKKVQQEDDNNTTTTITSHSQRAPTLGEAVEWANKLEAIKEECARLLSEGRMLKEANEGLKGQV